MAAVMRKKRSQGAQAVRTGTVLERSIAAVLNQHNIPYVRQHHVGQGIYRTPIYADFFLPEDKFIIEAKWQEVTGTADEKLPYLVTNIRCMPYPHPTVLVYGGAGWRPEAMGWVREQMALEHPLKQILTLEEFIVWTNRNLEVRQWNLHPMLLVTATQKRRTSWKSN